jgi:hypothetical protein
MTTPSPKQQLMQLISGYWVSQAVYGVAKLRIAEQLVSGPKTASELAGKVDCDAGALRRTLRALASVGVFAEDEEKRFALTEIGDCLREDSPTSARPSTIMLTEIFYSSWGNFLHSLQTGQPAFEEQTGQPLFEYLAKNSDKAAVFDAAMVSYMSEESEAIATTYNWPSAGKIMDVGGGSGGLIRAVLAKEPQLSGAIFDLPEVIDRNQELYEADNVLSKCEFHPGDFFSSISEGADIYMFRNIIHDWDDERSINILKNCERACRTRGKVLLLEYVIPEGNIPFAGKWLDLMMLVGPGGQERTEEEYRVLLESAGLEVTNIIPTSTEMSIIEAQPK